MVHRTRESLPPTADSADRKPQKRPYALTQGSCPGDGPEGREAAVPRWSLLLGFQMEKRRVSRGGSAGSLDARSTDADETPHGVRSARHGLRSHLRKDRDAVGRCENWHEPERATGTGEDIARGGRAAAGPVSFRWLSRGTRSRLLTVA